LDCGAVQQIEADPWTSGIPSANSYMHLTSFLKSIFIGSLSLDAKRSVVARCPKKLEGDQFSSFGR
jgi:hypothetical protein